VTDLRLIDPARNVAAKRGDEGSERRAACGHGSGRHGGALGGRLRLAELDDEVDRLGLRPSDGQSKGEQETHPV